MGKNFTQQVEAVLADREPEDTRLARESVLKEPLVSSAVCVGEN